MAETRFTRRQAADIDNLLDEIRDSAPGNDHQRAGYTWMRNRAHGSLHFLLFVAKRDGTTSSHLSESSTDHTGVVHRRSYTALLAGSRIASLACIDVEALAVPDMNARRLDWRYKGAPRLSEYDRATAMIEALARMAQLGVTSEHTVSEELELGSTAATSAQSDTLQPR